jgi:hypothetical protein
MTKKELCMKKGYFEVVVFILNFCNSVFLHALVKKNLRTKSAQYRPTSKVLKTWVS